MAEPVKILRVSGGSDLRKFLNLPNRLYKNDPLWAPQIKLFERLEMKNGTNPVLGRSPHALFLAIDGSGTACGRVICYEDPRHTDFHKRRVGFFGSFEADSQETANSLMKAGEDWFRSRGLSELIGPIDPVAECWGLTIEGYDIPPVFMSPHNPPEYPGWLETAGYVKAKDLLVYEVDSRNGYRIPLRYEQFEETFFRRNPEFTARRFNPRNFSSDVKTIVDILNLAVADNWGFVPVGDDERDALAEKLKLIVDPDAIWFIEKEGNAVACCLGFPDLNIPIRKSKGRLFPFGWLGLVRAKKALVDYRLWGLAVLPEFHGRGLDAILYLNLYRALSARKTGTRLEANYVLEDNPKIVIALEKLGLVQIKKYRVYGKELS